MRYVDRRNWLAKYASTDHATGMVASSRHACALAPFEGAATLGGRGVRIGSLSSGRGRFCYDPWELYARQDQYGVTNPNLIFAGEVGKGKSTTAQVYLRRQFAFGRLIRIIDPTVKGEWGPLAKDLDAQIIRLGRDGIRLNPLESPENRHGLLRAIAAAACRRPLTELEPALLNTALDAVGSAPTLPMVLMALFNPSEDMARAVGTTSRRFAAEARKVAMALQPLCEGDLAGLFDGPTSDGVDFSKQCIMLDLSARAETETLGILMACATSFLQTQIDAHFAREAARGRLPKAVQAVEEAWRVFSLAGIGAWLRDRFKFTRKEAQQNLIILHGFRDLDAAGATDSQEAKFAKGLLGDSQQFVLFRMGPDDAKAAQSLLGLSNIERHIISNVLERGQALWRLGQHRFVVHTMLAPSDRAVISTDRAMAVR